jgi:hypothetical protein
LGGSCHSPNGYWLRGTEAGPWLGFALGRFVGRRLRPFSRRLRPFTRSIRVGLGRAARRLFPLVSAGTVGVVQVIASLLISVLMLGHKVGTVNGIVNSLNRRKEIEELLEALERSQGESQSQLELPPALVEHARRLTLRDGDDGIEQVVLARAGLVCGQDRLWRAKQDAYAG